MSVIKFRVFGEKEKDFIKCCVLKSDGSIARPVMKNDYDMSSLNSEEYKICLYTGLKDKFGAEIYENDILKLPSGKITAVSFMFGCFCYDEDFTTDLCNINANSEIIGNTYKNADLLDK
ncbi:MAG: hypothetical protein IJ211_01455 [Campylobacter sp.]|nr:hypothetical protein [Campylobacter sp.]